MKDNKMTLKNAIILYLLGNDCFNFTDEIEAVNRFDSNKITETIICKQIRELTGKIKLMARQIEFVKEIVFNALCDYEWEIAQYIASLPDLRFTIK